jgi:folate-dependent phosphoribosylglycinamide formyltransferase PurN
MNPWIPVVITLVINVIAVAFALGKLHQTVKNLDTRMGAADDANVRRNDRTDKWEERMETKEHSMLPACIQEFKEINKQLGSLTGKVDTLIELNKK